MTLKLYGYSVATGTRRVAVVLHEMNVPFKLIPVDLRKGEQKSPEFMRYQPFGLTPYIDDDGFILYESRAICYYIASKYSNQRISLIPSELKANALFHQAASTELTSFDEYAAEIAKEKITVPLLGGTTDEVAYERLLSTLSAKLDVYDVILSKQKYLAGDEVTLADLYHLPCGDLLYRAGTDVLETRPNVKRWWDDISSRPSWAAVKDGVKGTTN
ncbi:hypothetical protein HYPSUDRAFT_854501 [Hypholoma sublateritium FD-334 SS-4]|uniref:glutathione transferase n=1 Tax=Hypholoma sublateritium (strain FD-334 SS-4) TaxID=945553 RepID=A0A0D2PI95_HYPSF|nr:hypothetical protein HYPSUDRAFT_854501 [Hypholoma sublateritium FD-334 SS-4]